jgi:Zn-dependent peptidase ImmA (M78 family)
VECVKVGGRTYSDPDVISLVRATGELVDPRVAVLTQAKRLSREFDVLADEADESLDPFKRLEILASLQGLQIWPMDAERQQRETRDAILIPMNGGKSSQILYNPTRPKGRVAFSIAHEIAHTFFPNSIRGARFRAICASDSREANELERLCDLGAAELLVPHDGFHSALGRDFGLQAVPRLSERFGSSYEATAFRLATTYEGVALAGLLRYRLRVSEEQDLQSRARQQLLFLRAEDCAGAGEPTPKYRRQSLHTSERCRKDHIVRWNKSFNPDSCAYLAGKDLEIHGGLETLPNRADEVGNIEAVRAPFQREDADPVFGDVLFLWWR